MPEVMPTTPAEDPLLVYADGVDSARSAPGVVAAAATTGDVQVLLGWTPEDRPWSAFGLVVVTRNSCSESGVTRRTLKKVLPERVSPPY